MQQITQTEFDKKYDAIWLDYLSQASQMDILKSVVTYMYTDEDYFFLNWLKDNPTTCEGVALACYWYNTPTWYKQFATREECPNKKRFDFIEDLERKYVAGFYQKSNIAFDPINDFSQNGNERTDWTKEYARAIKQVRDIPQIMKQRNSGDIELMDYPEDFECGLPFAYIDKVEALFANYEIIED